MPSVRQLVAHDIPPLSGRVPGEIVGRFTPDISEYTQFTGGDHHEFAVEATHLDQPHTHVLDDSDLSAELNGIADIISPKSSVGGKN